MSDGVKLSPIYSVLMLKGESHPGTMKKRDGWKVLLTTSFSVGESNEQCGTFLKNS